MDATNLIIIVISEAETSEKDFLERCGRRADSREGWKYALTDGATFVYKRTEKDDSSYDLKSCSFLLINPEYWEKDKDVKDLLNTLPAKTESIVWTHRDTIEENSIRNRIKNIFNCRTFRHKVCKTEIEQFMKNISPLNLSRRDYCTEFMKIVDLSAILDTHQILIDFLPLDIDMQVLDVLLENKDETPAVQYLNRVLVEAGERHYTSMFTKVKDLERKVTDGKIQASLKGLLGTSSGDSVLYGLLKHLDELKMNVDRLNYDDVQSVSNYFRKTSGNKYGTFDDWYNDLSRCLRVRS